MAKLILGDVVSFENDSSAVTTVNYNSALTEVALENTLSRDGTVPNQMDANLDMNSNSIINLPSPFLPTEPVRLQDLDGFVATAIAATTGATGFTSTIAAFAATTFDGTITHVYVGGYHTVGDGGEALYKKVVSEPSHILKVQSVGGTWWELVHDGVIHLRQAGIKTDGTNATTLLQGCIDALGTAGGVLEFPKGTVTCSSGISLESKSCITFRGQGGIKTNASPTSILRFTGNAGISLRNATDCHLNFLSIQTNSETFSGHLLDYSWLGTGSVGAYNTIKRCLITNQSVAKLCTLVNLDKAILFKAEDCFFTGGNPNIKGRNAVSFSNDVVFDNCVFQHSIGPAVEDAGRNWLFNMCTWEMNDSNTTEAFRSQSGTAVDGLTFLNCSTDDSSDDPRVHFSIFGQGVAFIGGRLSGEVTVNSSISLNNVNGVIISGVYFENLNGGILFDTATCNNVIVIGNHFSAVTSQYGSTGNLGTEYNLQDFGSQTAKPIKLAAHTVGSLPAASTYTGGIIYVSNGTSNKRLAISDGTNWRFPDGNVVS